MSSSVSNVSLNERPKVAQRKPLIAQEQLGTQVGVTRQTIAAIESGKYSPTLETAFLIADALGKSFEDVFSWG